MKKILLFLMLLLPSTVMSFGEIGAEGGWTGEPGWDIGAEQSYLNESGCAASFGYADGGLRDTVGDIDTVLLLASDEDSVHLISGPVGASVSGDTLFLPRNYVYELSCSLSVYSGADACDTLIIPDTTVWDTLKYIALYKPDESAYSNFDTIYDGDTVIQRFDGLRNAKSITTATGFDSLVLTDTSFNVLVTSALGDAGDTIVPALGDTVDTAYSTDSLIYGGVRTYTITIQNDGNGTTSPATDTTVPDGTAANLVATPTGNNTFLRWDIISGNGTWDPDSVTATTDLTPSEDITVKAFFLPKYTLTNSVNVAGRGTPSVASALVDSAADTTITFTGTDTTQLDSIQITSGTIDTVMTNDSVIVVTVHSDAEITAYYSLTTYTVTLTSDTHAALDTLNNGPWTYGSVCSVSVDLDVGYAGKMNAGAAFYSDTTFVFTIQSDTTFQVVDYLIPVIDSIRNLTALRDSVWVQSARIGDTLRIYGKGLYGSGSEAYVANQSSTGNTVFDTVGVPTDDSLDVTPDAASISGFFRSWISTRDGIVGAPKSRAVFIKKFYGE